MCVESKKHRDDTTGECIDCPDAIQPALVAFAVCVGTTLAVGTAWLVYTHPPRLLRPLSQRLHLLVAWASGLGWSKAKIGVAFYQCAISLHQTYDVTLPDYYTEWMEAFRWIELDWAAAVLPVECLNGYLNRMILTTTAPLAIAALSLLVCLCAARARRQSYAAAMQSALPFALLVVFSCASSTSRAIFMVWECAAPHSGPRISSVSFCARSLTARPECFF